jgi:hypothetical protein
MDGFIFDIIDHCGGVLFFNLMRRMRRTGFYGVIYVGWRAEGLVICLGRIGLFSISLLAGSDLFF